MATEEWRVCVADNSGEAGLSASSERKRCHQAASFPPDGSPGEDAVGEARANVEMLYRAAYGVRDGVAMLAFRSKRDALECAARAFFGGRDVVLPAYSDAMLRGVLESAGASIIAAAMRGERRMKVDADLIGFFYPYAGVLFATPSTASGFELGKREMKLIVTSRDGGDVVVVDEELCDYGANSILRFATKYKNVVTVRVAGRVSDEDAYVFAFGAPELIERMRAVARERGYAAPSAEAARAAETALCDKAARDERRRERMRLNGEAFSELRSMGCDALLGRAPFLLLRAKGDADAVERRLRDAGVRLWERVADADEREFLRFGVERAEVLPRVYAALGIEEILRTSVADPLLNRAKWTCAFVETPPDPPLAEPLPPYRWQQMVGMAPIREHDIEYWRKRRLKRFRVERRDGTTIDVELRDLEAERRRRQVRGEHADMGSFEWLERRLAYERKWKRRWARRREFIEKYGEDNFPREGWLDQPISERDD